jgi:hypothetical protein
MTTRRALFGLFAGLTAFPFEKPAEARWVDGSWVRFYRVPTISTITTYYGPSFVLRRSDLKETP